MKFILSDMLTMAKRKGYISANPFSDVINNTAACKPAGKAKDSSRVYLPNEKELLFEVMNKELQRSPYNTDIYVIFLLFRLGLRIGEVAALKWDDVSYTDGEIHVHSMQTRKADENNDLKITVVNYTKKRSPHGDRFLPISNYDINILNTESQGYKDDEFIFCDKDGRTHTCEIDKCFRKMCKIAGIEIKSSHDIRRTVASEMFNNGIPVEMIRAYMGHSDIKTTYGYILNNRGKKETAKKIHKSLKSMCGLKIV